MKSTCPGPRSSTGFPDEFGDLPTYSHTLGFGQLPDYGATAGSFKIVAERMGCTIDSGPLDWMPCYHEISDLIVDEPEISIADDDEDQTYTDPLGEDG